MSLKRWLFILGCSLPLILRADPAPGPDKTEVLAGEDDKAVPTAQPTAAADVREPVMVTRSAQAAPAFQLPDFVVTGSGERKALARRDGQNGGLDTSGGLRASPGEKGAGKNQMATKAERSSADERTYTARAGDGWVRAAYGLANTGSLDGMVGDAAGPWVWSLQGGAHNTDGGPVAPTLSLSQERDAALKGSLSFDSGSHGLWEAEMQGEGRARRWTASSLPDAWLQRDRSSALGAWSGQWAGTQLGVQVSGNEANARVPGLGTAYSEEGGKLGLDLQRTLSGRTGQTRLSLAGSVESLSQRQAGQRQLLLWDGSLGSQFEPFSHALLTLGLGLDAVTGDDSALLLGPRLEWQQRIDRAWGFDASFTTGLQVSRLQQGTDFDQDARLPNALLPTSRQTGDLNIDLTWAAAPGLALEAGVFGKQNEGHFLPDDPSRSGIWIDTPVRDERELGAEFKERWDQDGVWQELSVRSLRAELSDLPGATATFAPALTGRFALGSRWGTWKVWAAVEAHSDEAASLDGTWTLPAAANLSAQVSDDLTEALTVFLEGRNLTAAPWGDAPTYTDPAPYVGLGLELRF